MESTFSKNRERFDAILANWHAPGLAPVYQRLLAGDPKLTDEEILGTYQRFSNGIQTNTFSAAELEWAVISTLCAYRPHLAARLLERGLLALVYSFGDELTVPEVLSFVQRAILADEATPYGGLPPAPGLRWLREVLPTQQELLRQTLASVIERNRRELEALE